MFNNNYEILYRKWRPKKLNEVIGQDIIIEAIKNSFIINKLHSSYIFSGERGTGKTTISRLLAKSFNCDNNNDINNIPCNMCNYCINYENNSFTDIIEIDPSSKNKIEEIKFFIDNTKFLPIFSKNKIFILDEIHMLSKQGFNYLLKILEEPYEYTKFLLSTTDINKVPLTILSRCTHFKLHKIKTNKIKERIIFILEKENIKYEKNSIDIISKHSYGSMRDALNIIDQLIVIGRGQIKIKNINYILDIYDIKTYIDIIKYIIEKKIDNILNIIYNNNIHNFINIIDDIINIFHKLLINKLKNNINIDFYKNELYYNDINDIYQKINKDDIYIYYEIFVKGKKNFYIYPNSRLGFEYIIIKSINKFI